MEETNREFFINLSAHCCKAMNEPFRAHGNAHQDPGSKDEPDVGRLAQSDERSREGQIALKKQSVAVPTI